MARVGSGEMEVERRRTAEIDAFGAVGDGKLSLDEREKGLNNF
jgi:hypothetical protein